MAESDAEAAAFEVEACHANRAGEASVSLRHVPTGAQVMIHHVPFAHDYAETVEAECRRIQAVAAELAAAAVGFLDEVRANAQPQRPPAVGAAPQAGQPPNRFNSAEADSSAR